MGAMTAPENTEEPDNRVLQPERKALCELITAALESEGGTAAESFRDDSSTILDVDYQDKRLSVSVSFIG